MTLDERRAALETALANAKALGDTLNTAGRKATSEEKRRFDQLMAEVDEHRAAIDRGAAVNDADAWARGIPNPEHRPRHGGSGQPTERALCVQGEGLERRTMAAMFQDRDLLGTDWKTSGEYVQAILGHTNDPRLMRSMAEGSGSAGGFAVPSAWSDALLDSSLGAEVVRPLATVFPMTTDELRLPQFSVDHSTVGIAGGITAAWLAEGGALAESQPALRQAVLAPKKLGILCKLSSELIEDTPAPTLLESAFTGAMAWTMDEAFISGTGAGQPLGVMNATCTYTQAIEAGQGHATILWNNISRMWSRLHPQSASRAVWLCHPQTLPMLFQLSVTAGVSGFPVWMPANGAPPLPTLMGRPVIVTAHCAALGDVGDLILADFSRYLIGMRREVRLDTSIAPYFANDQVAWRFIARVDGMPADSSTTLLPDGFECSPFVVLGAR